MGNSLGCDRWPGGLRICNSVCFATLKAVRFVTLAELQSVDTVAAAFRILRLVACTGGDWVFKAKQCI